MKRRNCKEEIIMKEKLPWNSIITLGVMALWTIILAISGWDGTFLVYFAAALFPAILIAEIIGIIIRIKAKKRYADNIAVLIADAVILVGGTIYAAMSLTSDEILAGIGAIMAFYFIIPMAVISLAASIIMLIGKKKAGH